MKTVANALQPITKANFKKWHGEGALLLLSAGHASIDRVLEKLGDTTIERRPHGSQVGVATIDGINLKPYMFSNGVEEFVIIVDDMQGSDYSRDYFKETGTQHTTVYVVND